LKDLNQLMNVVKTELKTGVYAESYFKFIPFVVKLLAGEARGRGTRAPPIFLKKYNFFLFFFEA